MLKRFEDLPPFLQTEAVRPYYEYLAKKRGQLLAKRFLDILLALLLILLLSPLLILSALAVKCSSRGPIFYLQERVTQYGRHFRIYKFRTMVPDAQALGGAVTVENDPRVTRVGYWLRRFRLDEFPQFFNILKGDMTFVGTRPEVPEFVDAYDDEMRATLLLPAGSVSTASVAYKKESDLLQGVSDPHQFYIEEILPEKMALNLSDLRQFSLAHELKILLQSLASVVDL